MPSPFSRTQPDEDRLSASSPRTRNDDIHHPAFHCARADDRTIGRTGEVWTDATSSPPRGNEPAKRSVSVGSRAVPVTRERTLEARFTPGQVPHGGEYPSGQPARFIPVPDDVYMTDGSGRPCVKGNGNAAFAARWPTGAAVMPTDSSQLITYSEVCVTGGGTSARQQPEGWGYLLYNWRTHHIDDWPVDVFKPPSDGALLASSYVFGSPIFDNGNLTLFSSPGAVSRLRNGQVLSVTVPATTTALDNPASYNQNQLSTDGSGSWAPLSISVARYSTGLRLIEWTSIVGTYDIFSTSTLAIPWHLDASGTLPGCQTHKQFCFALEGHPELSTPSRIFVSYVDPDVGPGMGHVVMSAVPD